MHVGGDYHSVAGSGITSKENLEYNGVKRLIVQMKNRSQDTGWDRNELNRMKEDCDKCGVTLRKGSPAEPPIRLCLYQGSHSGSQFRIVVCRLWRGSVNSSEMEKTVTAKAEVIDWLKRSLDAVKTAHAALKPGDLQRKVKIFGRMPMSTACTSGLSCTPTSTWGN